MPRRKKLPKVPNYEGMARNPDNMLVQKSNPLQSLAETKMTLPEFKILDAYLSRIDSHKPDERYVRFEKGELEKLLGVDKINKADLEKRIDNLFQVVTIRDPNKPKGFTKIGLFEKAECEQDENGQWQVNLACSASAMAYVFNIENIGYLKYRLKNVVDLTSRYSYILYLYLENNRFRKSWSIPLGELKALLRCTAERYEQYKFFNSEILKKCHKELNEKTNIKYSYEPIKSGRKVTEIRFTLATQSDEDETSPEKVQLAEYTHVSGELSFDDEQVGGADDLDDRVEFYDTACGCEFSSDELHVLISILVTVPDDKLPPAPSRTPDTPEIRRYHYLAEKYATMSLYKPKNRFSYLKKIIEKDAKE